MGTDRKSKEKKGSRKRSAASSDSDDESRGKKQRSDKKEKGKDKKSHHKHRSDKERKSKDKHRDKHHKGNYSAGHNFQELTDDDYFSKNNEFATWLKEEKNVFFSDLSSETARKLFSDFVKKWNKQKLESRFYEGISSGPRSAHSWKFK